jgi:hypothetical protein
MRGSSSNGLTWMRSPQLMGIGSERTPEKKMAIVVVRPAARPSLTDRQHRVPSRPSPQSARAGYRLRAMHEAIQALPPVKRLNLLGGMRAPRLTLWDEAAGRLVRCRGVAVALA